MTHMISGGCLCGMCRYETEATPLNIRVCHCRLCQKAIGASFNARVLVPLDQLRISGNIAWYNSSAGLRRGFCSQCGTTLFSERKEANVIGLTMGSLDRPNLFEPDVHIWVSSKQSWLKICDDSTQYKEGVPA